MKESIEKAVKTLAVKAESCSTSIEAQQYTQAVANLTNALACIDGME